MKAERFTPESAYELITRNGGKIVDKRIHYKSPGLKILSAIDYLVNHCKHSWMKGEK